MIFITSSIVVAQRTREIGLMRAVGMARSQLRTMIRCEAGSSPASALVFPVRQLGILVAAATGAGLLAAILPARRGANPAALEAVHHAA